MPPARGKQKLLLSSASDESRLCRRCGRAKKGIAGLELGHGGNCDRWRPFAASQRTTVHHALFPLHFGIAASLAGLMGCSPPSQGGDIAGSSAQARAPDASAAATAVPSAAAVSGGNPAPAPPGGGAEGAGSGEAGNGEARVPSAGHGAGVVAAGVGGAAGAAGSAGGAGEAQERFSFFVTSLGAMRELAGNDQGFGGDLRFGKATGLLGADEICRQTAERSLPGSGAKGWRAFLSATRGGPNDGPIHAKDRVGDGPWYDRLGRLVAANKEDLLQERPRGADPAIIDDLPNEHGIPNHRDGAEGCTHDCPDNHQILTGTNELGMLKSSDPGSTCHDWTSSAPEGMPWCGHSWPREVSGVNWMSSAADGGCAPCVSLEELGGVRAPCVGSAGGYGGIYCFALMP